VEGSGDGEGWEVKPEIVPVKHRTGLGAWIVLGVLLCGAALDMSQDCARRDRTRLDAVIEQWPMRGSEGLGARRPAECSWTGERRGWQRQRRSH
jgi:hypothetical protein